MYRETVLDFVSEQTANVIKVVTFREWGVGWGSGVEDYCFSLKIYSMIFSALKRTILTHTTTWMNPGDIMRSQKDKYYEYLSLLMWGS